VRRALAHDARISNRQSLMARAREPQRANS
jgi:hypothetical protein